MKRVLLLAIYLVSFLSSECFGYAAIRPVPCSNSITGESGVCTFNWSCINVAHGVHIGPCVDRFFVGSCCKIPTQDGQTREEIQTSPYRTEQEYSSTAPSEEEALSQAEKHSLQNYTLKHVPPLFQPQSQNLDSVAQNAQHPVRLPVLSSNKGLTFLHDLRQPVTLHPFHNERQPVLTSPFHNQRRPVSLNQNHDKRWPVLDDPSRDQRKPVLPDGSHDLRWPVLEEDSHDQRLPVSNWFHQAMSHLLQLKPVPVEEISQNQKSTEDPYPKNNSPLKKSNISTSNAILPDFGSFIRPTLSPASFESYFTTSSEDLSQVCGLSLGIGTTGRIVGGRKSEFHRWPWMISLRRLEGKLYKHKCGAVLLGRQWAITAAHCIDGKLSSELQLRFAFFERSVKEMVVHPDFDPITYESDLALLRLYEPVRLGSNVVPICLPPPQLPDITGRWAVVTGWGRLSEEGELPTSLHEVLLPILSNAECEKMYGQAGYSETIRDIFVCAGVSSGGIDACEGDSGGPMVVRGDKGEWVLVGLISWGMGCAAPKQPGVYTRISQFTNWIHGIMIR